MKLQKKLTRSHTSVTQFASKIINIIVKLESVRKISLGIIKPNLKAASHRVKMLPITGGVQLSMRGSTSIQQIFVYTTAPEEIKKVIFEKTKIVVK